MRGSRSAHPHPPPSLPSLNGSNAAARATAAPLLVLAALPRLALKPSSTWRGASAISWFMSGECLTFISTLFCNRIVCVCNKPLRTLQQCTAIIKGLQSVRRRNRQTLARGASPPSSHIIKANEPSVAPTRCPILRWDMGRQERGISMILPGIFQHGANAILTSDNVLF